MEGFDKFKDMNGKSLPKKLVKKVLLPAQFASKEEAEKVEEAAKAVEASATSSLSSNFFVNLLLVGSVHQIWSVINSL